MFTLDESKDLECWRDRHDDRIVNLSKLSTPILPVNHQPARSPRVSTRSTIIQPPSLSSYQKLNRSRCRSAVQRVQAQVSLGHAAMEEKKKETLTISSIVKPWNLMHFCCPFAVGVRRSAIEVIVVHRDALVVARFAVGVASKCNRGCRCRPHPHDLVRVRTRDASSTSSSPSRDSSAIFPSSKASSELRDGDASSTSSTPSP